MGRSFTRPRYGVYKVRVLSPTLIHLRDFANKEKAMEYAVDKLGGTPFSQGAKMYVIENATNKIVEMFG